jgi:polar amino acid transport system substrate-binding protein
LRENCAVCSAPARAKVVTFSTGYYSASQAFVVLDKSPLTHAKTLADFKDAKIGAQIGTTSLLAAQNDVKPSKPVAVFNTTNDAKQALVNGQIDALVVDLPTAFYISAAQIPHSTVAGQFNVTHGKPEQFGLLFAKGTRSSTAWTRHSAH